MSAPPRRRVLPGLTSMHGWRPKVVEIDRLGLRELALFPTALETPEREELYACLAQTRLSRLPHVHIRDDFEVPEVEWLCERWQVQVFNIHATEPALELLGQLPERLRRMMYIENGGTISPQFVPALELAAGICLDFSHWDDYGRIRNQEGYERLPELLARHPVGCCHVSAVVRQGWWDPARNDRRRYNRHYFEALSDFDYLRDYRGYLPEWVSLELENPLAEQLQARAYLEAELPELAPA